MLSPQKIKILHVLHSFNMGGLENGVVNLINNSDPDKFSHELCCITRSGNAEKRLNKHIDIYEMHKQEGNDWRMIPRLFRLIKEQRPDIVHTRNWGAVDAIPAAKIAGVPVVIHGEHGWNMDDPRGQNLKRCIVRKLLSGGVDRFVAVSEDIKNWMVKSVGIRESKVAKILNGVDTDKFCPGNKEDARIKLGFLNDEVIIGTAGRLDPVKDQGLLLRAFARLNYGQKKLRLVLLGDGPEKDRLGSLRDTLPCRDHILFLGERDDVDNILKALDIFVLPSKSEGISNTILEAMATGLPVIATAVGGNSELVQDGHTGCLIQPDSCNALADALNFYIDQSPHLVTVHGHNAREKAVRDFSLDRMVKEYEGLYIKLAKERG